MVSASSHEGKAERCQLTGRGTRVFQVGGVCNGLQTTKQESLQPSDSKANEQATWGSGSLKGCQCHQGHSA